MNKQQKKSSPNMQAGSAMDLAKLWKWINNMTGYTHLIKSQVHHFPEEKYKGVNCLLYLLLKAERFTLLAQLVYYCKCPICFDCLK